MVKESVSAEKISKYEMHLLSASLKYVDAGF